MPTLSIGEVFGYAVDDASREAVDARRTKPCPFRGCRCTKVSRDNPLGVCGLADGSQLTTTCPYRFQEDARLFRDAAHLIFNRGDRIVIAPEIRILRSDRNPAHKIGKVDFIIGRESEGGGVEDFAAIEVQAVYQSGTSIRPAFEHFLQTGELSDGAYSRPDYRSSAQKRLMPQLSLKVPVFRRWGKRVFVAVDRSFFDELPTFHRVQTLANSEVTWLVYPFSRHRSGQRYQMGEPEVVFSEWGAVREALREGHPPEPGEVMADLAAASDATRFVL